MPDAAQRIADLANLMSRTMAATLDPDDALALVVQLASDTLARMPPDQRAGGLLLLAQQVDEMLIAGNPDA